MCLYKFLLLLSLFNILRTHDVLRENLLNEKLKSIPVNFKDANLNQSNVTFKLFVKSEEIKGRILDGQKINKIVLNRDLPAKFFIHGFRSNSSVKWYQLLKDVYFKRAPYNIFYVDWSKGAYKSYNVSAANVKPAGEAVGDFIMKSLISFENVHLIGDGLGAMVAGFAGKRVVEKTRKKLHRITATDPSAAKFEHRQVTKRMRLSEIDATFVECIHTDVGGLGFTDTVGHADFYPNGGFAQPECVVLPEEVINECNHGKAMEYFIESVNYPIYKSKKCDTWKIYLKGLCRKNIDVVFGEHTNLNAKGEFFHFIIRPPKLA